MQMPLDKDMLTAVFGDMNEAVRCSNELNVVLDSCSDSTLRQISNPGHSRASNASDHLPRKSPCYGMNDYAIA
jgi:hypothetical protein